MVFLKSQQVEVCAHMFFHECTVAFWRINECIGLKASESSCGFQGIDGVGLNGRLCTTSTLHLFQCWKKCQAIIALTLSQAEARNIPTEVIFK